MKKFHFFIYLIGVVFFCSGCDQVRSFLGDDSPASTQEQEPSADVPFTPPAPAQIQPNTLAQVGEWTLTIEAFDQQLAELQEMLPEFDSQDLETRLLILEELIQQQLLVEAAERQGIDQQQDIVEALEEFRTTLLVQELAERLTQNIEATEQEALEFYNENMDLFREDMQWRIREILLPDQARASAMLIELLQGADFAAMARMHSMAPTASRGGDTGLVSEFADPQVMNVALTLEPGGISSVFRGQDGFYIIKLEERRGGEAQSFEEIKEDLIEGLVMLKQQEAIMEYLEDLILKADIYINEDLL